MKRDFEPLDLRGAFPEMPADCLSALMRTVRSAREDQPMFHGSANLLRIAACVLAACALTAFVTGSLLRPWPDQVARQPLSQAPAVSMAPGIPLPSPAPAGTAAREFTLGPAVFSVRKLYCDPYIVQTTTLVHLAGGEPGMLCGTEWDSQIDPTAAEYYQVSVRLTWAEAARQLGCPLYRIWAMTDPETDIGGMERGLYDARYNRDGSLTFFDTSYLTGQAQGDTVSPNLDFVIWPYSAEEPLSQSGLLQETYAISTPLQAVTDTAVYQPAAPFALAGHTLSSVEARLTPAGVYFILRLTTREGTDRTAFEDNAYRLFSLADQHGCAYDWAFATQPICDSAGWPDVRITCLLELDHIPAAVTLIDSAAGRQALLTKAAP